MKNTGKTVLTIAEALKNANNTVNQDIKSQFVAKHVYCNVNSMVEYIINKSFEDSANTPFSYEDIINFYTYPEWSTKVSGEELNFEGGSDEDKQTFIENFDRLINESQELLDNEEISEATHERNVKLIEEARQDFEDNTIDNEQQEIFEYWKVSDYLAEKLTEKGACIIESESIWGRTTTGQAILLDYVISQICAEMEILQGQANSWEK